MSFLDFCLDSSRAFCFSGLESTEKSLDSTFAHTATFMLALLCEIFGKPDIQHIPILMDPGQGKTDFLPRVSVMWEIEPPTSPIFKSKEGEKTVQQSRKIFSDRERAMARASLIPPKKCGNGHPVALARRSIVPKAQLACAKGPTLYCPSILLSILIFWL